MKGRKAARLAATLADEVMDALARAGCTLPPRPDVVAAVWPAATAMVAAQKHLRQTAALHADASRCHEHAEATCVAEVAMVVAGWKAAMPPPPRLASRLVPFDPAATSAALTAVGRLPAPAPAAESA